MQRFSSLPRYIYLVAPSTGSPSYGDAFGGDRVTKNDIV